jgi:prepilin-type processing-associated H-X9-DG protein
VPLAALLAVIFGIIGIKQTRGNRVGGRGMAIAGLCLGGLQILVVPLVLASILFPAFSRGKAMAQRFVCAAQMGQIGRAIAVYESANGGAYPTDLPTLVSAGVVAPALFVCPSSHDTRANGAGDLMSGGHESYLYAGAGLTSSSSGRSVVLYEPLADHGDGINVLYADGSVRFVSRLSAGVSRRDERV